MAVISNIKYSELENKLRIEAEFYQPKYLEIDKKIKSINHIKLSQLASKISDGTHFTPTYVASGVKFFSALNVKENVFDINSSYKFISPEEHALLFKRCNPEKEDLLIRKVGVGPRWACVIPKKFNEEFSIFVSVALIKLKKGVISPYFISTFINSIYGQSQLLRIQKGVSQPDLHLEDISELKVPLFSENEVNAIEIDIKNSLAILDRSQSLYTQAQQLLEQELGLDKLAFEKPVGYEVSFNEVISGRRIDSQCYKPDFINYEKYLRQNSDIDYLRVILKSSIKGKQMSISTSGSINYASIKDIQGLELITDSCCNIQTDIRIAERDSLLLAITGATIGKIGIVNRYDQLAFSGDLLNLNLNDSIDPHYLLTVMQSPIGQSQCNRWITGSTNGHLAPKDVMKIVIPRLKRQKEETISEKVKESLQARFESEKLLEKAKTRVEQLIEQAAEKS